jgi:S1-C subfamily serine protease
MRTRSIVILLVAACAAPLFAGGAECQKKAARPWLGVDLNVDKIADRVTVERVVPDSPAERAGFRVGDQLLALNGVSYGRAHAKKLASTMNGLRDGETVTYTVRRNGAEQKLSATLGRMPDSVYEQAQVASR